MRRSISGPVILMAIGFLFFLNNFFPDVFTWHSIGSLWPFLLIGFGVVRLIEVLSQAGQAKTIPASQFPVGGVFFLIIACFLIWGMSSRARHRNWHGMPFVAFNTAKMFGESFEFDVQRTFPVESDDVRLVVEGLRGNVSIAGDDSSSVTVSGHKNVSTYSQSAAGQANKRTQIEIVRNGNDLIVRSTGSPEHDNTSISYDLDIRIPRRLSLVAQGSPENITAESVDGNVDVAGGNGNVRLTSIGGNVRVETTRRKDLVRAVGVKGTLDVRGTGTDLQFEDIVGQVSVQGNFFGTLEFRNLSKPLHFASEQTDLRVEKLPGSITMDLGEFRAQNVVGPLHLRCQSRDVHISEFSSDLEISVDRGDIELNAQKTPLSKIDVHVRAGDIDVSVPEKAPFALRATTSQGDVDNQYGENVTTNSEGRSATMKTVSGIGPAVTLTTDRGHITFKKS
jgi:DUF4097 and DUF4098 domain-containing protein YvlB